MTGYRTFVDPEAIAYCQAADCGEPLLYIYSNQKRKYCYCCTQKLRPYAEEILKEGGKK